MSLIRNQTLSIILVLSLVVGGIPLFFAATDNAEAAVGVWEQRDKALSVTHSNGKLTVDVSTFEDEGNHPIQGYTILLKWDACRKDLNPLSGFWRTIREPRTATITTDAKGQAEYKFEIPNLCWTENLWIYGSSEGWQNIEYFLGNIASTNIHLDIQTQASMATQHAMQRADTLGLIQDWYDITPIVHSTESTFKDLAVYASRSMPGAAKLSISMVRSTPPTSPTASIGQLKDYISEGGGPPFLGHIATEMYDKYYWSHANVKAVFGDQAIPEYIDPGTNPLWARGTSNDPTVYRIKNCQILGPSMYIENIQSTRVSAFKVLINGNQVYPASGWQSTGETNNQLIPLPYLHGSSGLMDIEIHAYATGSDHPLNVCLYAPTRAELILTNIAETDTTLDLNIGGLTIDLSNRWNAVQISGESSTLTSQDLVPVKAKISSIYPLVISNPRFDKTPIAGAGNGLKFDAYNLRDQASNETIYLSLIADGDTTVWSTTVGQRAYPAWTNSSQFTTVHLTDITFPAEPRKEYQLRITSGGAITEIPVVFYPAELDPEEIYGPKDDLDEIIKDYGTVNAAALKAYHDWAVSMQPRIEVIKADVQNYTKLFEQRLAVDNLAWSDAAATRGLELIAALKEICKGDGSATSIGELTSHAQGIWSSYQAALLYREAAISFEAGQTAFGNSTALDAWYQDLVSKRITVGLQDQKQGDDPNSVAVWVGVAVALVVGGLVMYLCWKYIIPPLKRVMPKGCSPRLRTIRAVTPVVVTIVLAVIIALVAFLATWNIALSIEAALR